MSAANLNNELQALVDNRLDAIDQNLLRAGLPRHQRRSIVEEVENQIFEMLSRLEVNEYTRADVLAVLAKLDPPEAYDAGVGVPPLGGSGGPPEGGTPTFRGVRAAATQVVQRVRAEWKPAWLACFAAGLGLFTLLLIVVFPREAGPSQDGAVIGILFLMLLAGVTTLLGALSLHYLRHTKGQKLALAAAIFATFLYPLLILNGVILAIGMITYPVSVGLLVFLLFVGINGAIGRLCWRWATRKPAEKVEGTAAAPLIITG